MEKKPKKEKKAKLSKPVAIIFIILMMGSVIAMIVEIFFKQPPIEPPPQKIIKYRMSETQLKLLLGNYYTIIDYEYPSACVECGIIATEMEKWALSSDNQIYLQEIQSDTASSSKLTVMSLRGQNTIYEPTQEDARQLICDLIISRPLFCLNI